MNKPFSKEFLAKLLAGALMASVSLGGGLTAYAGSTGSSATTDSSTTTMSGTLNPNPQLDAALQSLVNDLTKIHDALAAQGSLSTVQAAVYATRNLSQDDWTQIVYGSATPPPNVAPATVTNVVYGIQGLMSLTYVSATDPTTIPDAVQQVKTAIERLDPSATGTDIYNFYESFKQYALLEFLTQGPSASITSVVDAALEDAVNQNTEFRGVLGANGLSVTALGAIRSRYQAAVDPTGASTQAVISAAASTKLVAAPTMTVAAGDVQQYTIGVQGYPVTLDPTMLTWNSEDPSVADVDGDGNVYGVFNGTTTIDVYYHNYKIDSFQVTVQPGQTVIEGWASGNGGAPAPGATVTLYPANSGGAADTTQQPITATADDTGYFQVPVNTGSYVVYSETIGGVTYPAVQQTVQVSGFTDIYVVPQNDITFPVQDEIHQPVQNGYVAVVPQGTNAGDLSNADWFQVTNGNASGFLTDGTYDVVGVVDDSGNYVPATTNNSFTIQNGKLTDPSFVAEPLQANVWGTVYLPPAMQGAAGDSPDAGAVVEVVPAGSPAGTTPIDLMADNNGQYTDIGYDQNGNPSNELTPGQSYTIVDVWDNSGLTVFDPTAAGSTFTVDGKQHDITLPTPNMTGTVSLNGSQVTDGWIAFGPVLTSSSDSTDMSGQNLYWAQIQNGKFSTTLPSTGTYQVYAVQDNSANGGNGSYFDATQVPQNGFAPATNQPFTFGNDFIGQVTGSSSAANAYMLVSPIANLSSDAAWNQMVVVPTDETANFSTYLKPGQWYVVGVDENPGQNNETFVQLATPETITDPSSRNVKIDITPNVSGNITWASGQTAPSSGWVVFEDSDPNSPTYGQMYGAPITTTGGTSSYQVLLPQGQYSVDGIETFDASGNFNWIDLTSLNIPVTVPSSGPVTENLDLTTNYTGQVNGVSGSGYVIFKNDSTNKLVPIPFDSNGQFTTHFDASHWQPISIETAQHYYLVPSNSFSFSNDAWTVTAGQKIQ